MKKANNEGKDDREKLRMENELKKMKLILEHGAIISENSAKVPLDPFIENQFLNNIQALEESFQNAKRILLFDFLGRPDFTKVGSIPDSQISAELERIMELLFKNGIQLDTLCDVEEREIYRFVTEELFQHEMDDVRIPGMMNCFIYEEFHPNHDYDIRNSSIDGIKSYLDKKTDFYTTFFTKEALEDSRLKHFRESFKSFLLKHFEITQLSFNEEKALVSFKIDFTGVVENSVDKQRFSGDGSLELIYQYDFWVIDKLNFPIALKQL